MRIETLLLYYTYNAFVVEAKYVFAFLQRLMRPILSLERAISIWSRKKVVE